MKELICLVVFLALSTLFAIAMVLAGFVFQYKNNTELKDSTYECGIKPYQDANIRFDIKYFNYAIAFLIFDVETIFLYPFALFVNALGLFAIAEAFIFISLLVLGLVFGINKKLLRWA